MAETKKPLIILYVKASCIDTYEKGACPISQKWFMTLYTLVEQHHVNLRVVPISPVNPTIEFKEVFVGKRLPAVAYYAEPIDNDNLGTLTSAHSGNDEIEEMIRELFKNAINMDSNVQWYASDILRDFNRYLKFEQSNALLTSLTNLNEYLSNVNTKFLESDEMSYADFAIAPKLHHVRIAGNFFRKFEFPSNLKHLRSYIGRVYETVIFKTTCPADRDILFHYYERMELEDLETKRLILGIAEWQRTTGTLSHKSSSPSEPPKSRFQFVVKSEMSVAEFDSTVLNELCETQAALAAERMKIKG